MLVQNGRDMDRLEKIAEGKREIKRARFEKRYAPLVESVTKVAEEIEKADRIVRGLGELAELDKNIFGARDPATAIGAVRNEMEQLIGKAEGLSQRLKELNGIFDEQRVKRSEQKVGMVEKAMVALAGVIAVPILADFIEKVAEKPNPFMSWSIGTAVVVFFGSLWYINRVSHSS